MSASFVGRLSLSGGNNPRKPLSAAYQPKRPPGGGNRSSIAAQISSAANDHVVVINEEDEEQQQNVFHVDNANGKHGKPCLTGTVRSGTREIYLLIGVLVLMTVWLIVLTVFVARTSPPPPPAGAAGGAGGRGNSIVPILDRLRDPSPTHFKFPFILQPDDNTNGGRLQTVQPPENFTIENILSYDVCCMQASFYVCRNLPGIKNIGVDAYFDIVNKRLVVQVIHKDMVGAKCHLLWNVK